MHAMPFLAAAPMPIFLIFAAVIVFVLVSANRQRRAVTEAWQSAGRRLGLSYSTAGRKRKLEGSYRGFQVKINTFTQSSGNNSTTFTRYRVDYPDLGLGLELKHQHFFATLGRALTGGKDIIVGDKEFDDTVIVEARAANQAIAFLTPDRRRAIMRLIANERRALIRDSEASFVTKGAASDAQTMQRNLDQLIELTSSLTNAPAETAEHPEPQAAPAPLPSSAPDVEADEELTSLEASLESKFGLPAGGLTPEPISRSAEVAAKPEDSPWAPAPPADFEPVEEQAPEPAVEFDEAQDEFDESQASEPQELEAQAASSGEADASDALEPAPEEAPLEEQPEVAEVATTSSAVDYESLRADLFETQRMSHEVKDHFMATYEGKRVQWRGTLERLSDYNSDMVFEGGQGTRAMVALAPIEDGSFSKDVHAIVQLTREQAAEAKSLAGQEVQVTGQLHSCDGFMRNLFVSEGSLSA